jgi:hypothetical protein
VFLLLIHEYINVSTNGKAIGISDFDVLHDDLASDRSFNKVTLCRKRDTGQLYTVKTLRKQETSIWSERAVLEITNGLNTPFLPRMYWSFHDDECLYIVMVHSYP